MSSSQQIYLTVFRRLKEVMPNERLTRRRNLALFVVALYLASSCALTRLADHLLVNGNKDSRVQAPAPFPDELAHRRAHGLRPGGGVAFDPNGQRAHRVDPRPHDAQQPSQHLDGEHCVSWP